MNENTVLCTNRYDEAEHLLHETSEARKSKLSENHPDTLESKNDLAVLYKEQGLYDKVEPLLREAVEGRRLKLGDTHPYTLESLNNLIDLYEAWNKPEKPKSGEQNRLKQKLKKSDMTPQKWSNFDSQNPYNLATTPNPLICLFPENP